MGFVDAPIEGMIGNTMFSEDLLSITSKKNRSFMWYDKLLGRVRGYHLSRVNDGIGKNIRASNVDISVLFNSKNDEMDLRLDAAHLLGFFQCCGNNACASRKVVPDRVLQDIQRIRSGKPSLFQAVHDSRGTRVAYWHVKHLFLKMQVLDDVCKEKYGTVQHRHEVS